MLKIVKFSYILAWCTHLVQCDTFLTGLLEIPRDSVMILYVLDLGQDILFLTMETYWDIDFVLFIAFLSDHRVHKRVIGFI